MGASTRLCGRQPPDGPPVCTALNFFPLGMPPPMSWTISRSVMPIGTSMSPELLILPTSEKILVPLLVAVPTPANQAAPRATMSGTFASVSTLLMTVGWPHAPTCAG
jgi:hypothetical protein